MANKPPTKNNRDLYITIGQLIGFALTCGIVVFIWMQTEKVSPVLFSIIFAVGFLAAAIVPIMIATARQNSKNAKNRRWTSSQERKKSDKPSKPVQKFIPHVLTEPVPDEPVERVYSRDEIRELSRFMQGRWNERAEEITIQLLQEFKPEDRLRAQKCLHDFKMLRDAQLVVGILAYAKGDLERLNHTVKWGNLDLRDLYMTIWN